MESRYFMDAIGPGPITDFVFMEEASFEMRRRGISDEQVKGILTTPQQTNEIRPGRWIFQSRVILATQEYLIRVFVDIDRPIPEVVTAYRTSRISKYWSI